MFEFTLANGVAWVAVFVFMAGAIANWVAPPGMRAAYEHWGYPAGFHYVTSVAEFLAALLLSFPATRIAGAALGGLVMAAALGTVVYNREFTHAVGPAIIGALCAWAGWLAL